MSIDVPCKDCSERKVGCHSECSKYKFFRICKDAINKRVAEERKMQQACDAIAWRDTGGRRRV